MAFFILGGQVPVAIVVLVVLWILNAVGKTSCPTRLNPPGICRACGASFPEHGRFCPNCGRRKSC